MNNWSCHSKNFDVEVEIRRELKLDVSDGLNEESEMIYWNISDKLE
jgi:hypothetical protein